MSSVWPGEHDVPHPVDDPPPLFLLGPQLKLCRACKQYVDDERGKCPADPRPRLGESDQ